ncbi:MAG: 16S rRNA processing protein RimM [Bacteroidetes bacterium]|nr:16S rRNA processing protein RimM [Bacteroidota bacterium]
MEQYFSIGKMVATFRLQGEIILEHNLGKKTNFKGIQVLFVESVADRFLPYFIVQAVAKNEKETYIKLEGVDSKESAHKLCSKKVWLSQDDFRNVAGKTAPISLIGYRLFDKENELGVIEEIIEQPHQILCRLIIREKEVLIPLNESTIQNVNHSKKLVHTDLPDGLLEIYL